MEDDKKKQLTRAQLEKVLEYLKKENDSLRSQLEVASPEANKHSSDDLELFTIIYDSESKTFKKVSVRGQFPAAKVEDFASTLPLASFEGRKLITELLHKRWEKR